MSDLRVDTKLLENKFGLHSYSHRVWSVTPVWQQGATGSKKLVTMDAAGAPVDIIRGIIRIFEAKTSAQHREAVEVLDHDLLWDGPPIRLSNKGHVRLAAYLFKYFAHLRIVPIVAAVSEPSPGCTLIELDAVAVSYPHRPWLLPITWLLPNHVAKNVHFKIGVNPAGKVELLVGRLTNVPAFLPFAWQRSLNGIIMGALPHALEGALGYVFDAADGGDYYARKRNELFKQRHPGSANPTWDWLTDLATDIPEWAASQGTVALETAQAVFGSTFERIQSLVMSVINFYIWLFNTVLGTTRSTINSVSGKVQGAAESAAGTVSHYAHQPGTSGAGEGVGVKTPAPYVTSGGAARRVPVAVPVTTTIGGGAGAY